LAKSLEQISQVDTKVFKLSNGLKETLEMFYFQPYWGFIICKLAKGSESYHPFGYSHNIIDKKIYIPTRHYHQEAKWEDFNQSPSWALGYPLDPKQNPLNSLVSNPTDVDSYPMFREEQFRSTGSKINGWVGNFDNFSNFDTLKDSDNLNDLGRFDKLNLGDKETNGLIRMSSRVENLKKLNNKKFEQDIKPKYDIKSQNNDKFTYKQIADDWSHSIYLLNINPNLNKYIKQMNTCKEIWDAKSLFDPEKINFNFGYCNTFVKLQIDGTHPNMDLVIPASA
jgi:hypothetical protein